MSIYIESPRSRTLWPEICSEGQKGPHEILIYHQKESITLYSLKIFEDTLTTNKFKTSVMDIYMAYEASEGVCIESHTPWPEYSLARKKFSMSNMVFCQVDITNEDISLECIVLIF